MSNVQGQRDARILIVCDPPKHVRQYRDGVQIAAQSLNYAKPYMRTAGFEITQDNFAFLAACPPLPEDLGKSAARLRKYLAETADDFEAEFEQCNPEIVVTWGKVAAQRVAQKAVAVTKARGKVLYYRDDVKTFHMLSPEHVRARPENMDLFTADWAVLHKLFQENFNEDALAETECEYEWCDTTEPLDDLIDRIDAGEVKFIGVDTEGNGLEWHKEHVRAYTVQLSYEEGHALVVPVGKGYRDDISGRMKSKLRARLKTILENPDVKKAAHNIGYDRQIIEKLGIHVKGWYADTMLLAFFADDNMLNKSLSECVRRWVPAMQGYSDLFDATVDKSRMDLVPHDDFLTYAGGDADAVLRLAKVLITKLRENRRLWQCYWKIHFPMLLTFSETIMPQGTHLDEDSLETLGEELEALIDHEYERLIDMVPDSIKDEHRDKGLKFSRPSFVRDILFNHVDGLRLTPRQMTATEGLPSLSAKEHLIYFEDHDFVKGFMGYQKLSKMRSTYIGRPEYEDEPATGFWKHLHNGKVYPSFFLHRTATGRTASADPNGQNLPKRGTGLVKAIIKAFRKCFVAPPGWKVLEVDLSQAELRIVAWMANEQTMLRVYRSGGDIHRMTAARVMGISLGEFDALPKEERDLQRFRAKAVNFGFIYGMSAAKFRKYAKAEYGLDLTEAEAIRVREVFFETYPGLIEWHERMREDVHANECVYSLHGAIRRLPGIKSDDRGIVSSCERQAINAPIQRFASDIALMGIWRLCRDADFDKIRPYAFIHDSLLAYVREDVAEEMAEAVKFYMESVPYYEWFGLNPPIPITADAALGDNWGDVEELDDLQAVQPEWYREDEPPLMQVLEQTI